MLSLVTQSCQTLCYPVKHSPPGSSVHGQEYWSGLPYPPPGDLPNPGIKSASPMSLVLQADSSPAEPLRKPHRLQRQEQIQASAEWMRQLSVAMAALKESRWGHGTEGIKDTEYLEWGRRSSCFLMDTEGLRDSKRANTSLGTWRKMIRRTPGVDLTDLPQPQTADMYFLGPDLPLPLPAVASESS